MRTGPARNWYLADRCRAGTTGTLPPAREGSPRRLRLVHIRHALHPARHDRREETNRSLVDPGEPVGLVARGFLEALYIESADWLEQGDVLADVQPPNSTCGPRREL